MIPVEAFINPPEKSWEYNAIIKAVNVQPEVITLITDDSDTYYLVKRHTPISKHIVQVYVDKDGQQFIHCDCPAGNAPIDVKTRLPEHVPVPCYHAAAVLLSMVEK